MTVVCAWCQHVGRVTVLGESGPQDDVVSHGICDEHALMVLAEAREALVDAGRPAQ